MAAREVVTEVTNARLYSDGTILFKNVRLSYPHIETPWASKTPNKDGSLNEPKFSATGLLLKSSHKAAKELAVKAIDALLLERNKGAKIKADAKFFRDGDLAGKPEAEDHWTISASESAERPPKLRLADGKTPYDRKQHGEVFYPGCRVNMLVRPWWQDNDSGKRVNANLLVVQFVGKGDRIGEAGIDDDDVDEMLDDESSEDDSGFDDADDGLDGL